MGIIMNDLSNICGLSTVDDLIRYFLSNDNTQNIYSFRKNFTVDDACKMIELVLEKRFFSLELTLIVMLKKEEGNTLHEFLIDQDIYSLITLATVTTVQRHLCVGRDMPSLNGSDPVNDIINKHSYIVGYHGGYSIKPVEKMVEVNEREPDKPVIVVQDQDCDFNELRRKIMGVK